MEAKITTIGITYAIVEESDAPFIYYFSPSERAIIIERADGADRWTLMKEMFAPRNVHIYDLRWSNSGEWLIWETGSRAWALRFDLSELREIEYKPTLWSPVDDFYIHIDKNDQTQTVTVVDFETQQIMLSFETLSYNRIYWSGDGQYIYYTEAYESTLIMLSLNGDRMTRSIFQFYPFSSSVFSVSWRGSRLVYLHPDKHTLLIEDISTGEKWEVDQELPSVGAVRWSPDGNYALLYSQVIPYETPDRRTFLLSIADDALYPIEDDIFSAYTVNWMPNSKGFFTLHDYQDGIYWGNIRLYSVTRGESDLTATLQFAASNASLEFSDDGKFGYFQAASRGWLYDLDANRIIEEYTDFTGARRDGSPHERYVATSYIAFTGNGYKYIEDRVTDERHNYPFHRSLMAIVTTNHSKVFGSVWWHPNSEWVQFTAIIDLNETQECFYSFADVSGSFYREIPDQYTCAYTTGFSFPAWVPDNVPLDDIR